MKTISRSRALIIAAPLLLAVLAAALLFHLRSADVVATLASATPGVTRDFRGHEQQWVQAALGDTMRIGDAARTTPGCHAVLSLKGGATMMLDPDTIVRFLESAPQRGQFRVEAGFAALQTGEGGVQVETALGLFALAARTTVRLEHRASGTHLRVDMGKASLMDPNHLPQIISAGEELFLRKGELPRRKKLEESAPNPGRSSSLASPLLASAALLDVEPEPAEAVEETDSAERVIEDQKLVLPPQPARADVNVRAGEQATVHDPGQATQVRLHYEHVCPKGEAIVDIAGASRRFEPRASSAQSAVIRVMLGKTRYRVRCPSAAGALRVVSTGQIRMVRDAAVRRVPMRPPTNEVDLDGRRYTVLYQNLLPAVVVRAPGPSHAGRVVVRSGSRLRTFDAVAGAAALPSGDLTDGVHTIFFESLDGRTRSPMTTLSISFDNAAPLASIDQRGEVARDGSGQVRLSGVVPLGSHVSLAGQALEIDAGGRFEASTSPGQADAAVSLRVEHPRAGLHYYVRRIEGAGAEP
jgi:hypothetical protein